MPYAVEHHYRYEAGRKAGSVFLCIKTDLAQAEAFVATAYAGRFMAGRDTVVVKDERGNIIKVWEVDYMPQFEALPGKQWPFPSSRGYGSYTTQINTTGILSCNCKGWTMKKPGKPRSCKHTEMVAQREGLHLEEKGQYLFVVDERLLKAKAKFAAKTAKATGPQERFAQLLADYESAIGRMAALDPNQMFKLAAEVEVAKFKVESYMLLLEEHGIDGTAQFRAAEAKLQAVLQ